MMRQAVFAIAILNFLVMIMAFMVRWVYYLFFGSLFVATSLLVVLDYFAMEKDESERVQNEINQRLRINTDKLEE